MINRILAYKYTYLIIALLSIGTIILSFSYGESVSVLITQMFVGVLSSVYSYRESKRIQEQYISIQKKVDDMGIEIIDNPEYVYAIVDSEQHFLFGIKRDGSIEWSKGVPTPIEEKFDKM